MTSSGSLSTERPAAPSTATSAVEPSIRVTFADTTLIARLADNPTANDLLGQLPVTLTFRDFNHVEKIADPPRPLTTVGAPPGADPDIGDIAYYAPSNNLVLYYGDVAYWNGIIPIGRFNTDIAPIEAQADGFTVTVERAE
jgi:hypothetical protein